MGPGEHGGTISPGEWGKVMGPGEYGATISPGEQGGLMGPGEHRGNFSPGEPMLTFAQAWDRRMNLAIQEYAHFGCTQYGQAIVVFHSGVPALES